MKGLKKLRITLTIVAGFLLAGFGMANEVEIKDNIEDIYYEGNFNTFDFLDEVENIVLEPIPEKVIASEYYNIIATQTLTEEEVLEALAGLSRGESAVERALAVNIAGSAHLYEFVFNALTDNEESVRTEAEFFSKRLLLTAF